MENNRFLGEKFFQLLLIHKETIQTINKPRGPNVLEKLLELPAADFLHPHCFHLPWLASFSVKVITEISVVEARKCENERKKFVKRFF
jgi:hypothetical protein